MSQDLKIWSARVRTQGMTLERWTGQWATASEGKTHSRHIAMVIIERALINMMSLLNFKIHGCLVTAERVRPKLWEWLPCEIVRNSCDETSKVLAIIFDKCNSLELKFNRIFGLLLANRICKPDHFSSQFESHGVAQTRLSLPMVRKTEEVHLLEHVLLHWTWRKTYPWSDWTHNLVTLRRTSCDGLHHWTE